MNCYFSLRLFHQTVLFSNTAVFHYPFLLVKLYGYFYPPGLSFFSVTDLNLYQLGSSAGLLKLYLVFEFD